MATEGATGLGTAAIEAAIDHWATHRHEAVVRDVEARAELAALTEAAGYGTGLVAALIDAEYILTRLLGAGEFVAPRRRSGSTGR